MDPVDDIGTVINLGHGFLVNQSERSRYFRVHNLAHLHGSCRAMLANTPLYHKFYARTTHEITVALGPEHEQWDLCGNCQRNRP